MQAIEKWVKINEADGKVVTTSLHIARVFDKRHENVLRDIREMKCSDDFQSLNFELLVEMKKLPQGGATKKEYYLITKDGFSFLAMGYTGEKAAAFKESFIKAFNQYEGMLKDDDYIINRALDIVTKRNKALEQRVQQQSLQIVNQEKELKEAAPKVEYYDDVLQSDGLVSATEIGHELGISAMRLNRLLIRDRVQRTVNGVYVLLQDYVGKGLSDYKTSYHTDKNGGPVSTQHLYWTQAGRKFILDKYGK